MLIAFEDANLVLGKQFWVVVAAIQAQQCLGPKHGLNSTLSTA